MRLNVISLKNHPGLARMKCAILHKAIFLISEVELPPFQTSVVGRRFAHKENASNRIRRVAALQTQPDSSVRVHGPGFLRNLR